MWRPAWVKYVEARRVEVSARTLNNILATVRGFLGWAVSNEHPDRDPLATIGRIDATERRRVRRAFSDHEIMAILKHAGRYDLAVRLALGTGLRRGEIRDLQWRDVHLEGRSYLQLRPEATKSGRGDVLPLPPALAARRPSDAAPTDCVTRPPALKPWLRLLERAGVAYLDAERRIGGFHGLRLTFVTNLQRSGTPGRVVQALARHTDPRLTHGTYTDLSLLDTFGAAAKLPTYDPPAAVAVAEGTTDTPLVPWDQIRDQKVCKNGSQACEPLQDCSPNTPQGSGRNTQQNKAFSGVSGGNLHRSLGLSKPGPLGLEPRTS